jgi:hypothetical protein
MKPIEWDSNGTPVAVNHLPIFTTPLEHVVLRAVLDPRDMKGTEGWRQVHSEVLHNLYSIELCLP